MLAEVPFVGLVAAFLPPRVFGKISLRERAERLIPNPFDQNPWPIGAATNVSICKESDSCRPEAIDGAGPSALRLLSCGSTRMAH